MKYFLIFAFFSLLSTSVISTGFADASSPAPGKRLPVEPSYRIVLRSLLYPGWGQLYNAKYVKAVAIFASEAALLRMIYHESREASKAYEAHLVAPDRTAAARLYAKYEDHFDRRESLIWWTAGLVLFSLADAYVDANLTTFEEEFGEQQNRTGISLRAEGRLKGGFISLHYVFH